MKDIKNLFRRLEKMLRESKWFDDDWEIYNRGPYLQLYKTSWHNQNQGGIHFETSIESAQIRNKALPIAMHAEEDCPSRQKFLEKFLQLEGARIKGWKTYQVRTSENSVIQRTLPLNYKNLEQRIYGELNQLRQLADGVDQALQNL